MLALAGTAIADSAEPVTLFSLRASTEGPVAAVTTNFAVEAGKAVRVTIYDSEEHFLEEPFARLKAVLDEHGVAFVPLSDLAPGEYALAAYLDVNGDGKLNRGKVLGRPKEPVAFSNGVKPKLRKPRFDETKDSVAPDSIVVISLDD